MWTPSRRRYAHQAVPIRYTISSIEVSVLVRRCFFAAVALATVVHVAHTQVAQQNQSSDSTQTQSPASKPEWTDIPFGPPTEAPASTSAASLPEIKFPNYASCSIAEIRKAVSDLAHLKAVADQAQLKALLDEVGTKTVETANKTPNLISQEAVVTGDGRTPSRENYSFLILQHAMGKDARVFDEYRVDVATGEKLQTEFIEKNAEVGQGSGQPSLEDLPRAAAVVPLPAGPKSQGFVSAWLYFYPANRKQLEFRYLGQQRIDSHQTQVVAFAQKPESVQLPSTVGYNNKNYPIYMQGVAWIDANDFRIVRLRSDLLSVSPGVPLFQLTAEIEFAEMSIADVPSPLWLPTQLNMTTNLGGTVEHENHTYTNYRLFRTRSRMVLK